MQRVHDFLGIPARPTAEPRPLEPPGHRTELPPSCRPGWRAAFEPSDAWLAEHLEEPPPWRT